MSVFWRRGYNGNKGGDYLFLEAIQRNRNDSQGSLVTGDLY